MAELNVTPQMIKEYRTLIGNFVLSDSAISEMIKKDIETGKLPKEFATLATDAQKAGYNANTSNLFGFGFNTNTAMGLSFERTIPKTNQNEQHAKKIASSVKENSRWYKDWGGSSLVAECKKATKDNILYTFKEFEKISPDKNLVLTITDNSTINVEKQKEALKHIFNVLCNLAKDKGVDTTHFEKAFKTNISQTRTETRVSSTGMPSGTCTKEVLTDSNITTINNIIVGLRNSIEVKANPNVYNQIALALTPEEQIQEQTIGSLKYKHSLSLEALENQNRYDGWAGELADWMSEALGSKNREKHVRADLEVFNKQITELEEAKKVSKEAFEKKFEEIFGIKYDAELIVNYQQVEQLYQMATSCYQLEQFFKSDLKVLLSNSTLQEETKTVSIDPMTSLTQTTVLATKEQVFEREFNKLANFVGQGNLENGKPQLEEVFKASGLTETSTLQEKYTVLRQVAQNYAKALHDNTMQITGNKGYEAIAKDFDDAYKSAFGVTNDIARRVAEYNISQQAGAGVIKSAVMIGGTIALGTITGGVGLSFFPALAITSVGAGAITATTEFSDRLSSGYVIEGFKENGIEGAIEGVKQALPDEEIIRILKSSGITTLAVATGGILGAGVEIGAQALNMSILTKSLVHIAVGIGVGAGAEYLHTGSVSVQGVVFAFVLSSIGQVIAITKVGTMDNGKVTFDKQAIKQARQDLGLADDVVLTEEVLKKAYRKMSIQTHPDRGGTAEAFIKVNNAYELLMKYIQPTTVTGTKLSVTKASTKSNTTVSTETNPNMPALVGEKTLSSSVQVVQQNTSITSRLVSASSREEFVAIRDEIKAMPMGAEKTKLIETYHAMETENRLTLNDNQRQALNTNLEDLGIKDPKTRILLINFMTNSINWITSDVQESITNAQLNFLSKKGATSENTYLLAPQPNGTASLKSYTNAARDLIEISQNAGSQLKIRCDNVRVEYNGLDKLFVENKTGQKFIVITDDCSISGASILEDTLTKLNPGNNLREGQNVEIVFAPTVLGTDAKITIDNFIDCYNSITKEELLDLKKNAKKYIQKDKPDNLSENEWNLLSIILTITDGHKTGDPLQKIINNLYNSKAGKGGKITFSIADVSETNPLQLAKDYRKTNAYQNLTTVEQAEIDSWYTANGNSFGYHGCATSVVIEGYRGKGYDFNNNITSTDAQVQHDARRALGIQKDGNNHNLPTKGNAPNNNAILPQIFAKSVGVDISRIKVSGLTDDKTYYQLVSKKLTTVINKHWDGTSTKGNTLMMSYKIKKGGLYDGKITIGKHEFDSSSTIEIYTKEGTKLLSKTLPNIPEGTPMHEAVAKIRETLNPNNIEFEKATVVYGKMKINDKYDGPLEFFKGETETFVFAVPEIYSQEITVKVNGVTIISP